MEATFDAFLQEQLSKTKESYLISPYKSHNQTTQWHTKPAAQIPFRPTRIHSPIKYARNKFKVCNCQMETDLCMPTSPWEATVFGSSFFVTPSFVFIQLRWYIHTPRYSLKWRFKRYTATCNHLHPDIYCFTSQLIHETL